MIWINCAAATVAADDDCSISLLSNSRDMSSQDWHELMMSWRDCRFCSALAAVFRFFRCVKLIKKRLIKVYDDRKDQIIIHIIYSKMIIQRHIKNLIFMSIIRLRQQILILDKSWMRKHEVSYHEKTNIIEFISEFCTHSKRIKTKTTKMKTSNKEKNIFLKRNSFWINQITSNSMNQLKTRENSLKSSKIFLKKKIVLINQRLIFLEKTKNRQNQSIESKIRKRLKILSSLKLNLKFLTWKKNCQKWISQWSKHSRSTWWINEKT
jgi:hypothetical protein